MTTIQIVAAVVIGLTALAFVVFGVGWLIFGLRGDK